jgi:multisubunit Na+/H+ antiporter MnhE subunit
MLLVWKLDYQNIIVGIIASLLTALFVGNIGVVNSTKFLTPVKIIKLIVYVLIWLGYWVKSSLNIIILSIFPFEFNGIKEEKVGIELKNPTARILLTNTLTLCPDILVSDIENDELVIQFTGDDFEKVKRLVRKLEKMLKEIYL